jgi:hypothetical protein
MAAVEHRTKNPQQSDGYGAQEIIGRTEQLSSDFRPHHHRVRATLHRGFLLASSLWG